MICFKIISLFVTLFIFNTQLPAMQENHQQINTPPPSELSSIETDLYLETKANNISRVKTILQTHELDHKTINKVASLALYLNFPDILKLFLLTNKVDSTKLLNQLSIKIGYALKNRHTHVFALLVTKKIISIKELQNAINQIDYSSFHYNQTEAQPMTDKEFIGEIQKNITQE